MNTFSIKESLTFGWETFKKRPLFFLGVAVAYMVASFVVGFISGFIGAFGGEGTFGDVLEFVISILLSSFLGIGAVTFMLAAHDRPESVSFHDVDLKRNYWQYLGTFVITFVAVIVGVLLLIVPGIFLAIRIMFGSILAIDRGLSPIESVKEAWRITKGHWWQLFGLSLCIGLLYVIGIFGFLLGPVIGMAVFFIWSIVVMPTAMLAFVHVYRKLEHAASEVTPVPTA